MADNKPEEQDAPKKRRRATKKTEPKPAHEGASDAVAESLSALRSEPREPAEPKAALPATFLLFQEPDPAQVIRRPAESQNKDKDEDEEKKPRRRGSRGRGRQLDDDENDGGTSQHKKSAKNDDQKETESGSDSGNDKKNDKKSKSEKNSKKQSESEDNADKGGKPAKDNKDSDDKTESKKDSASEQSNDDAPEGTTRRRRRRRSSEASDEVSALKGSTRLEAKRQRRKEGREAGRRRHSVTESEFLARRESVDRTMLVREQNGLNQIAVIEDGILVEHYVARHTQVSMVGNVYLGRVQNVLPSMEAAFVDIGKGRNAVLYAGEVNWDAAGMEGKPRRIEQALSSGDTVLVQVTKDPIGHKGARLTGQITLAGRHLVLVPSGAMTGISRKLPEPERQRLKKLLKEIVPSEHGVIVRTAAEGATEEQLRNDVERLTKRWADIQEKSTKTKNAPTLLKGEPELAVRVVRDVFNEDFQELHVQGKGTYETIRDYVHELSPELDDRVHHWVKNKDIFAENRVDEQLAKAMDRKVFLPSGGSLVIDRTEAMTVIDVNTGKFTGSGGTLEETVTKNNLESAEEIVRQLRLRDIGGIIVIDFIDMVLESNRDLVLRRLIECLGRDRTRHQVAEVTSLGLVQMTRKRVGQGLVEAFSTTCECCEGRGFITHEDPVEKGDEPKQQQNSAKQSQQQNTKQQQKKTEDEDNSKRDEVRAALASIAAAAQHHHDEEAADSSSDDTKSADQKNGTAVSESSESDAQAGQPAKKRTPRKRRAVSAGDKDNSEQTPQEQSVPVRASDEGEDTPESRQDAPEKDSEESTVKRRRVSSTGTIVPKSSSGGGIMSFPIS